MKENEDDTFRQESGANCLNGERVEAQKKSAPIRRARVPFDSFETNGSLEELRSICIRPGEGLPPSNGVGYLLQRFRNERYDHSDPPCE